MPVYSIAAGIPDIKLLGRRTPEEFVHPGYQRASGNVFESTIGGGGAIVPA